METRDQLNNIVTAVFSALSLKKINGAYQRYNHYFRQILFIIYKYIKI